MKIPKIQREEIEQTRSMILNQEKIYDPNSSERICCIELENNNKVYLSYKETSTIRDLIKKLLHHSEFKKLYPSRNWYYKAHENLSYFDLHVLMYNGIKHEFESRLSLQVRIDQLHEIGLIKNHKTPFFILKDNRTPLKFPYGIEPELKLSKLEEFKKNNYNFYAAYNHFLPRTNANYNIPLRPEVEYFFRKNRNGLNELSKFNLNPLIAEDGKLDWFIYDAESMRFLMEMNKIKITPTPYIKEINGKVFFEDKCESTKLTEDELKKFFVNLTMVFKKNEAAKEEVITRKMPINLHTTAYDLINSFNRKTSALKADFKFNPDEKILKARGLNDFIFEVKTPMVHYSYINECLKENREAHYVIVNNPANNQTDDFRQSMDSNLKGKISARESRSSVYLNKDVYYNENQFTSLLQIATYNQGLDIEYRKIKMSGKDFYSKVNNNFYQKDLPKGFKPGMKLPNTPSNKTPTKSAASNKPGSNDKLSQFMKGLMDEIKKDLDTNIAELKKNNTSKRGPTDFTTIDIDANNLNYVEVELNEINQIICDDISNKVNSNVTVTHQNISKALKTGINKQPPNIYKESAKEVIDMKSMINKFSNPIDFKNLNRTFTILFLGSTINKSYDSYPYDKLVNKMVLVFKLQLYCGSKPFSKPKQIKYSAKDGELNLVFREKVNFEVNYQNIPNYCSLSFKVKQVIYDKYGKMESISTISWVNFRLFDHNKQLRTGTHKLGLFEQDFNADSYYCITDETDENASTVTFEIESFPSPLTNKSVRLKKYNLPIKNFQMNNRDMEKFSEIMKKTPFEDLNKVERDILWNNRYALTQMPYLISKLVGDFHFTDYKNLIELEKFFIKSKELTCIQSIDLLSGKYLNDSIRNFAVKCIKKAPIMEVNDCLLQLVQGLKYEMDHDSELARYILQLSINNPTTIGHSLFWSLKSEMYNQNVQQRFGLYLEVFLFKIGRDLSKIFYYEDFLVKKLLDCADIAKENIEKEEKTKKFNKSLEELNSFLSQSKYDISIPLNFKFNVIGVDVNKCKIMKSKKKPLWLTFKNSDPVGEDIVVMFKKGDDLRMDMVTLQLFKAMQYLWYNDSIKLKMSLYKVMCTGYNQGMLEMVTNSETLASIQFKEGGGAITSFFSKSSLKKWLDTNCVVSQDERNENFLLSTVAYCAATFVLGVGDRHNDNIMVKKNGELFHIDFGHFLGHFKYKMGIKRERAPFVFTEEFQHVLGGEKGERYAKFQELFWKCYKTLRVNAEALVSLLRILLCTGIPELDEKSIKFLGSSLALKLNDDEALKFLNDKIKESLNCLATKFNFAIHIFVTK